MKKFEYLGLTFNPTKTLKGKTSDFFEMSKRINDIGITPKGWDYDNFYEVAKENGAGEIDLFEVDGTVVTPAKNYLFQYR